MLVMLHNQALPSDHGRDVKSMKGFFWNIGESTKDKKMSTELSSIPGESKKVSTELRSIPVESVEMNWMGTDICSLSESNYFGQATCGLCF